jgi:hypothetical protein
MSMTKRLVPRKQAAELLGLKPHTLAVKAMRGDGPPYVRVGGPRGRCFYAVEDLEAWIAARTFTNTAQEVVAADAKRQQALAAAAR